jgi:hypothetical protein
MYFEKAWTIQLRVFFPFFRISSFLEGGLSVLIAAHETGIKKRAPDLTQ